MRLKRAGQPTIRLFSQTDFIRPASGHAGGPAVGRGDGPIFYQWASAAKIRQKTAHGDILHVRLDKQCFDW